MSGLTPVATDSPPGSGLLHCAIPRPVVGLSRMDGSPGIAPGSDSQRKRTRIERTTLAGATRPATEWPVTVSY